MRAIMPAPIDLASAREPNRAVIMWVILVKLITYVVVGLPVALLVLDGEGHGLDRLAEPVEPVETDNLR
jgi:hypothetical protein